ncbi:MULTISPECIES: hypothetical protein [unclassified Microcoleus]|uniref:hypothetical protein n=1 Tax=unclassified Microcoleus TaxID=2642155 RepID=UPI002FD0DC26
MALLVELDNVQNWIQTDSQSFNGKPIPDYVPPYQFEKHILAIFVSNPEPDQTWRFGGFLNQKIRLGVGPSLGAESVSSRKLWLGRAQLFVFPKLTTSYTLLFSFPYWFNQVNLTIWEYWGPEADTVTNAISSAHNSVLRVENKVNLLLNQPP